MAYGRQLKVESGELVGEDSPSSHGIGIMALNDNRSLHSLNDI